MCRICVSTVVTNEPAILVFNHISGEHVFVMGLQRSEPDERKMSTIRRTGSEYVWECKPVMSALPVGKTVKTLLI